MIYAAVSLLPTMIGAGSGEALKNSRAIPQHPQAYCSDCRTLDLLIINNCAI